MALHKRLILRVLSKPLYRGQYCIGIVPFISVWQVLEEKENEVAAIEEKKRTQVEKAKAELMEKEKAELMEKEKSELMEKEKELIEKEKAMATYEEELTKCKVSNC